MWQILIMVLATNGGGPMSISTELSSNKYLTEGACSKVVKSLNKQIKVNNKDVTINAECIKMGD